ncbi:hypothetical protein NQ317_017064 [Molorchus minor]|uniref:Retrotransposon gag domain-containing protein n=1 Tax=Molorchus minor TaxID=1323400 RepID=A0ABQ9K7D0_9CUCU|nr:hypothetical protein NQ317_017064 [Molorchus minor]
MKLDNFKNAASTAKLCKIANIFDIFNSRDRYTRHHSGDEEVKTVVKKFKAKKFQELSQLLNHQFSAAKSIWRERVKFYELSQGTRSISEYYAAVRGMATKCNFGTDLPNILKDKFVTGLSPGKVLDRLCEKEESATLENLYALAMKKEQSTIVEAKWKRKVSKSTQRAITPRQEYQPEGPQNTEIDRHFDRCQNGKSNYANWKSSRGKSFSDNLGHIAKVCKKNNHINFIDEDVVDSQQDMVMSSDVDNREIIDFFNINLSKGDIILRGYNGNMFEARIFYDTSNVQGQDEVLQDSTLYKHPW